MGFGTPDELATTPIDLAKESLGDVNVEHDRGRSRHAAVPLLRRLGGSPPEMIYANRDQIGSLAARGAIIPLDRCIEGRGHRQSTLVESAPDQVTFNGSVSASPSSTGSDHDGQRRPPRAGRLTIEDVYGSNWDADERGHRGAHAGRGGDLSVIGVDSKPPEFLPLWRSERRRPDHRRRRARTVHYPAGVEPLTRAVGDLRRAGRFQCSEGLPRLRGLLR